jgi:hypothetical protein
MKPAIKTAIVITCILIVVALLNPPWINSFSKHFLGFHSIFGDGAQAGYLGDPKIDYGKLILIILSISTASVATYFISTSNATHIVFASLGRNFKPLAVLFSWLEKYWLWLLITSIFLKMVMV